MSDDTITLNCGNCAQQMRIHKPIMTRMDNGAVSAVMLVPNWSTDERNCPGCGYIMTPMFEQELKIRFASLPPAATVDAPRIVAPGPLPLDLQRKLRVG